MIKQHKEIFENAERERAIQYVNNWVSTIIQSEQYKYKNYEIETYVLYTATHGYISSSSVRFTDIPFSLRVEPQQVNWDLIPKKKSIFSW